VKEVVNREYYSDNGYLQQNVHTYRERRPPMFGSEILEVAIGLVFVYFLLSLLCTVLNEWVARILALRSNTLEAAIRNLLSDDEQLVENFYGHALVKGLFKQGKLDKLLGREGRPSYIPSYIFAHAWLDTVAHADRAKFSDDAQKTLLALMDTFAPADKEKSKQFEEVRDAVGKANLPGDMQQTLVTLIDNTERDIKKARENIEVWFDASMDRVSGWYRRKVAVITLCLALLVSVTLNADTVMIAQGFSRDATLRASLVAAAEKIAEETYTTDSDASEMIEKIQEEVQDLQLPIGWSSGPDDPRALPSNTPGWLAKIGGLLLTIFAVSLGAPFWFDMLNKLVNLRRSGESPKKASEEEKAKRPAA